MTAGKYAKAAMRAATVLLLSNGGIFALAITHGPYLIDQTETAVTMLWFTDVNCFPAVEYGTGGNYGSKVEGLYKGLVSIGTRHEVRLTGLTAGQTYNYRAAATEVTSYIPYYSTLGGTIRSANFQFTTFNKNKAGFSFYFATDILSDANRMNTLLNLANWASADFMVFGGDVLADLTAEASIFSTFVDPSTAKFAQTRPVVFVRGNQEMNGNVSPKIYGYVPNTGKEFYSTFSHGPALFLVFDTGEDTADAGPKYGGLIRSESYVQKELAWFQNYVQTNGSLLSSTPFKIALAHQPDWGYGNQTNWDNLANSAGVKLLIAGHRRTYTHTAPGSGKNFHTLVVGQDQLCRVTVSATQLSVTVVNGSGTQVDTFTVN